MSKNPMQNIYEGEFGITLKKGLPQIYHSFFFKSQEKENR